MQLNFLFFTLSVGFPRDKTATGKKNFGRFSSLP